MRALLKLCCWLAAAFVMALPAFADEIRPALLEVTERAGDRVDVTWKVPTRGDRTLALAPVLPDFFVLAAPPVGRLVNDAWVEHTSYSTGGQPLTGAAIVVDGLAGMSTDVLLRIRLADGTEHSAVLRGSYPEFTIPPVPSRLEVASSYWEMGTLHILEGYDHLLFLLTLLLIVTGIWPLLKTVTAFTVAHSLTLALATLGFVNIPSRPTEAVISLSILLLAVEALHKSGGRLTLAERFPWFIAFCFGLVHGLGFAGALAEIGLPQNEVPLALLMFNVGVETGQIMFVVGVSLFLESLRGINAPASRWLAKTAPYAIGGLAAFWTIDRVGSFLLPA